MLALLYDFSDSSDEEDQRMQVTKRQLRYDVDVMDMTNAEFKRNFRMDKNTFTYILNNISPHLAKPCRGSAVNNVTKLATVLRFLATGGYQKGIGNEFISSLSQSKVCEVTNECLVAMEKILCPKWIKFNVSVEEERNTKRQFFEKFDIPGVIGCVDGTHIKIMAPKEDVRHLYYNRKGYYSLNAMMICDSNLVIRYVDARHPGANHDAFVWSTSDADAYLKNEFLNGKTNTWLLGDGGYQCLPYLLTPYRNPSTEQQIKFNAVLTKARNSIERCFGVLKNRFRCLIGERGLHYSADKAKRIVNVCCALHNICVYFKNEWPPMDEIHDEENNRTTSYDAGLLDTTAAQNIRDEVANSLL